MGGRRELPQPITKSFCTSVCVAFGKSPIHPPCAWLWGVSFIGGGGVGFTVTRVDPENTFSGRIFPG